MPYFSPRAGGYFFVGGRENEEESSDGSGSWKCRSTGAERLHIGLGNSGAARGGGINQIKTHVTTI